MNKLSTAEFKEKIFNFENNEVFKGEKPAVIKFGAAWCKPCEVISKTLEEISKEYPNVNFYSIDIDESFELSGYFKIKSIPQILYISNKNKEISIGTKSKNDIINIINKIL